MLHRNKKIEAVNKLQSISKELKGLKSNLQEIKQLNKLFTFQSLIPEKYLFIQSKYCASQKQTSKDTHFNKENMKFDDKQNKNTLNMRNPNTQNNLLKKKLQHQPRNQQEYEKKLKNKNEQLRAMIVCELGEIKKMEKRQESTRRINQKLKAYNSEHKSYVRSTSNSSKRTDSASINKKQSKNALQISESNYISNDLQCDQIAVNISHCNSVFQETEASHNKLLDPKVLVCPNGHQYFEGNINSNNLPHGHGRLEVCCNNIPQWVGGPSLKNASYFQGQFSKGLFNGYGTLSYKDGIKYVGQFKNGTRQGKGSLYHQGKAEIAKWKNDKFISII